MHRRNARQERTTLNRSAKEYATIGTALLSGNGNPFIEKALPVMKIETKNRFELFTEKAQKLSSSRYATELTSAPLSYKLAFGENGKLSVEHRHPDDEALDAVAVTLRFFTQPRDNICLIVGANARTKGCMDEVLLDAGVSSDWKDHYRFAVDALRTKLAGPAIGTIGLNFDAQLLTAWKVFETIFYGELAHANPDKRRQYKLWRSLDDAEYELLLLSLHNTVGNFLIATNYIRNLCHDEIAGKTIPSLSVLIAQAAEAAQEYHR